MFEKEFTLDRVVRWVLVIGGFVFALLIIRRLSGVLLPFFVAWFLAYLLYPLVHFIQYRLHFPGRILSIAMAMLIVLGVLTGACFLIIPPLMQELSKLSFLLQTYFHDTLLQTHISSYIESLLHNYADSNSILTIMQQSSFIDAAKSLIVQLWDLIAGTLNMAIGVIGFLIVLLYMFFILKDYEAISRGWIMLIPHRHRRIMTQIFNDLKSGMNAYFRGQGLIALCVGILFSAGFLIIDFPLAIGLGLFIGALNMVPYLQLIGFIPTILLAILKSIDTGQNLWIILLMALAVFAVVQAIQDLYLTPKIMGHAMGLNPAVILLSLSIWGSLLGIIGIIIALPLTTILLSYYKRYVLKEEPKPKKRKGFPRSGTQT